MTHSWILDVLADLKTYARAHDLEALAAKLDDAQRIAAADSVSATRAVSSTDRETGEPKSADNGGEARSIM